MIHIIALSMLLSCAVILYSISYIFFDLDIKTKVELNFFILFLLGLAVLISLYNLVSTS